MIFGPVNQDLSTGTRLANTYLYMYTVNLKTPREYSSIFPF